MDTAVDTTYDGPPITYHPVCSWQIGKSCADPIPCPASIGQGRLYIRLVGGDPSGVVCLGDDAVVAADPTPGMVMRAFQRLAWPGSTLTIQPPGGRTLVNFETNFYTDDHEPVTRLVTLLGKRITVEATPVRYTWHFGDGHVRHTRSPGAAYPDLEITNSYLEATSYRPHLDTTYGGRYRIGAWQEIPGTVTVTGTAQSLEAIEASPVLVGY